MTNDIGDENDVNDVADADAPREGEQGDDVRRGRRDEEQVRAVGEVDVARLPVVIPLEDVVEYKGGKKVTVQKKIFPGYLLCRADLDDDAWSVVRQTPGVTGFVGPGTKPTPVSTKPI